MFTLRPWRIGRVLGIPIGIDPSWIIIFLLLTYQLATIVFPAEMGIRARRGIPLEVIALAVIASLLLFASVLAHELAHAYVAIKRGTPVLGITLFLFGGVAQIGDEPDGPWTEFLIAIIGPLMSFLIAIIAAAVWVWAQAVDGAGVARGTFGQALLLPISVVAFYLAQSNLLLAVFNLLPGFPLDGGRVVRALLWAGFKDLRRATRWAMIGGRGIALLMVLGGMAFLIRQEWGGAWLFLMAWFLWRAAGESYHAVVAREMLHQVTVQQVMRAPALRVSEGLNLRQFVDSYLYMPRPAMWAVDVQGNIVGVIGAEQAKAIKPAQWDNKRVRDAMIPLKRETTVSPGDYALRALQILTRTDGEELAVVENGMIIGSVGREDLARYLQTKGE